MPCVFQGTTGSPKGATLSHRNIVNNANLVGLRLGITNQVGLGGNGVWECLCCNGETTYVENAGVYSVEGQDVLLQMTLRDINAQRFAFQWNSLMFHFSFMWSFFLGKKSYLFVGGKHEINHFSFWWILISNNYKTLDVNFEFCWMRF